jgi:glycosyltransferase involved in cell wall biosynthesis
MKIMTAIYTIRRGGAYDRFIMMVEAFLERNCEMHCLSLTPIPINHSNFHNHVIYLPLKTVDGFIAKFAVAFLFPLWSLWIAWSKKIDLIVAFGSLYASIQSLAKWLLGRPMVTLIRGRSSFGLEMQNSSRKTLQLNKLMEGIGFHFSDRIITNNVAARDEITNNLREGRNVDVQVLYNDIPAMNILRPESNLQTRDKYGIPANAKVLVTAGILTRGKNIELLIKCLPKIEWKNVYVVIIGDGSTQADLHYRRSLLGLAKKLEVDERVIFTGWLEKEELLKIYLASDLFVLPSLSEGMPNALLEALGAGLPCIGSNIAGVKDILQHEDLLFDPEDERALVSKIQQLLSDRQCLDKVKRLCGGRKTVFLFDWKERVFEMITMTYAGFIK